MMTDLELCVTPEYTIKEVMDVIEKNRERGVVIVEYDKVCGVLTLGNIISALSSGRNLYSKINDIYTRDFIYLNEFNYEKAFEIFKKRNLSFIPVIDGAFKLLGLITPREVMERLTFK